MKVCFFTNEFPPNIYGGAGVHVDYLSREMKELVELHVKCFGAQDIKNGNFIVEGVDVNKSNFCNVPADLSSLFATFYKNLSFFNSQFSPDIVHCHTWYSYLAGIIAKLAYGKKLVVTTHSLEPLRPWKREQMGKGYDLSSWLERQALDLADVIIAVSKETKQDVLKHFDVPEEKVKIVPNGIDIDEYKPIKNDQVLSKYGISKDQPYLLFVGRITRQKGIIHLVDAIPYLDPNIQVVLCAGVPDTEEIKMEMEEHITSVKKNRDNVIWISEMLSNQEKIAVYSGASVFCCPSIYEPFGIINLEAMACGTPVVGTKIGGIPEIIVDGKTGLLVPLEMNENNTALNPEKFSRDLASAVNKIVNDENLMRSMSEKSIDRAKTKYSWKGIARDIFNIYENMLK